MAELSKPRLGGPDRVPSTTVSGQPSMAARWWGSSWRSGPDTCLACVPSTESPTVVPSRRRRPRASPPSSGPFRPTCEPAGAARRRGRPPRTSLRDGRSPALEAQVNGATFPRTHRQPFNGAPSTARTSVRLDGPLDSRSSIGNQNDAPYRAGCRGWPDSWGLCPR